MEYVVVDGVAPYDGRYELDLDAGPTTREWGYIKRLSGYMPLTIQDGLAGVDPELFSVLAVIALRRAGKIDTRDVEAAFDRFADLPFTGSTIRLESDQAEPEEPDVDPSADKNGNASSSGPDSRRSSGRSEGDQSPTGTPASATAASAPTWSAS
jgi:hypothetical protein